MFCFFCFLLLISGFHGYQAVQAGSSSHKSICKHFQSLWMILGSHEAASGSLHAEVSSSQRNLRTPCSTTSLVIVTLASRSVFLASPPGEVLLSFLHSSIPLHPSLVFMIELVEVKVDECHEFGWQNKNEKITKWKLSQRESKRTIGCKMAAVCLCQN